MQADRRRPLLTSLFRSHRLTPVLLTGLTLALAGCEALPSLEGASAGGGAGSEPGPSRPSTGVSTIVLGAGGMGGSSGGGTDEPDAVCGNGVLEAGEICDDGGTEPIADGCSEDCLTQDPEFDCSSPGEACVDTVVCGNGILEGDEACDDKNTAAGDGCAADCSGVESGFVCARPGVDCTVLPVCGNSKRERGEECDDGDDSNPADGCHECVEAANFFCVPGQPCVPIACGDGNRTKNEECDDGPGMIGSPGAAAGGDGCSATCTIEAGWRCSADGCSTECGDGVRVGAELGANGCDDGNRVSGDGCSAACQIEPFFDCSGSPSMCASTIVCGNSAVEPGEVCDPPGADGCNAGCKSFSPDVGGGATCGNNIIEAPETCDAPDVGNGCDAGCQEESGWSCPRPNECFLLPACGDGVVQNDRMEGCDDGNTAPGDGCDASCQPETDYSCFGLGPSVCVQEICGDGIRTPGEGCDEGMGATTAGCVSCTVTSGWVCPTAGEPCFPRCGDSTVIAPEECDFGDTDNGDGCNAACRIEPGFACDAGGCSSGVCGNGTVEVGEGCDDDNLFAGDGCGPTCQPEPAVTRTPADADDHYPDPVVQVACGDGVVMGSEACDDGNTEAGDGCSADCSVVEDGYECAGSFDDPADLPGSIGMSVTYRDFRARDVSRGSSTAAAGGHTDFEWEPNPSKQGMVGPVCTATRNKVCDAVPGEACASDECGTLDLDGKPVFHIVDNNDREDMGSVESEDTFALWFRDANPIPAAWWNGDADLTVAGENGNIDVQPILGDTLLLNQQGAGSDVYSFESDSHFPIDGLGFGDFYNDHNYHFTTELRYFFQYQGGERLTFKGDDDVWVFVNGRLAVDIGGVHGPQWGQVVLGDDGGYNAGGTDSDCTANGSGSEPAACALDADEADANDTDDTRFGLQEGGVYEIVLYHAERHTSGSNFNLTLAGFLASSSVCTPKCGDGIVVGYEVCDDGANNQAVPASGECSDTCLSRAYCGDGDPQAGESCDNGVNDSLYSTGMANECAPGCEAVPSCGDGEVQAAYEQCDNGSALNSDAAYGPGSCNSSCGLGLYCGDDDVQVDDGETCDDGSINGTTYGPMSCGYDCQGGPRCGDGVRNGPEECDDGAANGTMGSNCNTSCTLDPFCGDGVVSAGEQCDYGQFASDGYGGCTDACQWGPSCGDASVQSLDGEECDLGTASNTGEYGGCAATCTLGPSCGDGVLQGGEGEQCDNGFNDDTYAFTATACGAGCQTVPSCGDGVVQSEFELCDAGEDNADGAYDGCSTTCDWGPYCGDGVLQAEAGETCDRGLDNTAYSAEVDACGYDCQPAAFCGDGERNGNEQCDLGTDNNSGDYGGCTAECLQAPRCGDGVVQADEGEQCDAGPTGSLQCSTGCRRRDTVK